jgi:class 3 adenylate cyclase/TolB-like protein
MVLEDYQNTDPARGNRRRTSERRLAAILGADIRGYSALMSRAEEDTHRRVGVAMNGLERAITRANGRVFSFAGDGFMAEFPSAVDALRCALRMQSEAARRNAKLPPDRRIEYRVGINAGEIVVQKGRSGGNTINVAARLEQIAEPGTIFLSAAVFEQVSQFLNVACECVGERDLKGIRRPVLIYRIPAEACDGWQYAGPLPTQVGSALVGTITDARASIAVLPFRTMRSDQTDAYFAEGMVDDIIRLLGGLKELLVIERTSAISFTRSPLDLRRIALELDVRYVLHGSVHHVGENLRISVELSEVERGHVIWADRFDGKLSELFELQDRIAMQVLSAVAPEVRERELNRAKRKRPDSMTAYDLTLQALDHLYTMEREAFLKARQLLRQAVKLDRTYSSAHAYLTYHHILMVGQEWSDDPEADGAAAIRAGETAVEHDRNDAMALAMYGHSLSFFRKDFRTAKTYLDRAIIAGPSCSWAWSNNSFTCQFLGDPAKAVAHAQQAVRLSPIGPDAFWHEHALSQAHYLNGDYEQAASWGRMSAAHNGRQTSNLRTLIASLVAIGEAAEARPFVERLLQVAPAFRLATFSARTPLTGATRETFVGRLRLAGLPD